MSPPESLPRDGGPVFGAPWEAQAFALAVSLQERGFFSAAEWAEALGAELAAAGPCDDAGRYYEHWLKALETLLARKSMVGENERRERQEAWQDAARHTPHGRPVVLRES